MAADAILQSLRALGVLFTNPPAGVPKFSGINFDGGGNPTEIVNPAGVAVPFPAGGATAFSALTDKTSADLPAVNAPLAAALAGKAIFGKVSRRICSGSQNALLADVGFIYECTSASDTAITIRDIAAAGWTGDCCFGVVRRGAGAVTVVASGAAAISNVDAKTQALGRTLMYVQDGNTDNWDVI